MKLLRHTTEDGFVKASFKEGDIYINPNTLDIYTPQKKIALWRITPDGYKQCVVHIPISKGKRAMYAIYEHRLIVFLFGDKYGKTIKTLAGNRAKDGLVIDHIDSNKLNNKTTNLQILTNRQNGSREKVLKTGLPVGVCWDNTKKKFAAYIQIEGKRNHIGYFSKSKDASIAYQEKLKTLTK